jgi:MYXO-CTERM domain-containing protein
VLTALLVLGCFSSASADQVVVTEVRYVHSATTTSDSHYRLEPLGETPPDLRAPVDYASGSAWVRLEVFTKPSDAPTRFQVCFEASPTYACTDQAPVYRTTGIYEWETPFSRFYQGSLVDWSRGLGRVALILKDDMNRKPAPENVGEEISRMYMPTEVRVTVTLVSPGGTYVPPAPTMPDAGMLDPDAGAPDAGPALPSDGGRPDAGTTRRDGGPGPTDPPDPTDPRGEVTGSCSAAGSDRLWFLALAAFVMIRSRRSRRR